MTHRNRRRSVQTAVAAILLFVPWMIVYAGGPPIVTVRNMPEYFVVGQPATVRFAVRALWNGEPLDGKSYGLRATAGRKEIEIAAKPLGTKGEYTATLTLPEAGEWTISVVFSTLGDLTHPLLPVKAILSGSATPQPLSLVSRGERFFVEKSCVSCHVNKEVPEPKLAPHWIRWVPDGPNLTGKSFSDEYLRKILANGVPTPRSWSNTTVMPNLNLTDDDIDALVAYINRPRPAVVTAVAR